MNCAPSNALCRRRLPVFLALSSSALEDRPTRHIRIAGLETTASEDQLMTLVSEFGPVQCVDTQELVRGEAIVSYYDIRSSTKAFSRLRDYWDCAFEQSPSYPEYSDFLVFQDCGEAKVEEIVAVLEDFGEVQGYMRAGKLLCVQFFDTRARAKAHFELSKLAWLERYEDVLDASELTYEPAPHCEFPPAEVSSNSTTSSPGSVCDSADPRPEQDPLPLSFAISLEAIAAGTDLRTSIMIKNIPNKYSQLLLLETIDKDYRGLYDFFYLPIDFKNKCNVGYAFLNFLSPSSVVRFYTQYNEQKWTLFNSSKVCEVTYGRIQGRSALIQHFQASSVMSHEDARVKPVILPLLAAVTKSNGCWYFLVSVPSKSYSLVI